MTAKVDTSLTMHAELQERAMHRRPAITRLLWHMVLREMNVVAANGGTGIRVSWQAMSGDEPICLLDLNVDYPTLFIYRTWQYDTALFTQLVADAGFPHLSKDNTVTFIEWGAPNAKE